MPILSHWYDSTPKKIPSQAGFEPGIFALEADVLPLGQRGGLHLTVIIPVAEGRYYNYYKVRTKEVWMKEDGIIITR